MNGKIKENISIIVLVSVSIVVGFGSLFLQPKEIKKDRYYYPNSAGAVLFEHKKHADEVGECAACHHELLKAAETIPCTECHDDDFNPADFSHAEMKEIESHTCTTCHQVNELAKSQNCRVCHETQYEEKKDIVLCKECHEESYHKDLMTHDELAEVEEHSCDGCHYSRAISNVYHEQCSACHIIENEEKFTTADGKISCKACHLK